MINISLWIKIIGDENMEIKPVGLPKTQYLKLPFFAYGIFKPGQLAYPEIEEYVKGEPSAEIINHEMRYRDGLALIFSEENKTYKTSGYLMEFKNPKTAYRLISKSQNENLYEWKQIQVNGKPANALVGVDANNGSFKNHEYNPSVYDYRQDHFFNEALEVIEDIIKEFEGKNIMNMKDFFRFQMNYMLLWSIIERFCALSYGFLNKSAKFKFAKEKPFENKLENNSQEDSIYSSDTLEEKKLKPEDPEDSIMYYYTIRCNVVHKGKAVKKEDMNKLKSSLEELFELFIAVYNEKLIQNNKIREKYPEKRLLIDF
jgi:hypothetical protein